LRAFFEGIVVASRPQSAHKGLDCEALGGIILIDETLSLMHMGCGREQTEGKTRRGGNRETGEWEDSQKGAWLKCLCQEFIFTGELRMVFYL
jgi:hypothetical protein